MTPKIKKIKKPAKSLKPNSKVKVRAKSQSSSKKQPLKSVRYSRPAPEQKLKLDLSKAQSASHEANKKIVSRNNNWTTAPKEVGAIHETHKVAHKPELHRAGIQRRN